MFFFSHVLTHSFIVWSFILSFVIVNCMIGKLLLEGIQCFHKSTTWLQYRCHWAILSHLIFIHFLSNLFLIWCLYKLLFFFIVFDYFNWEWHFARIFFLFQLNFNHPISFVTSRDSNRPTPDCPLCPFPLTFFFC